MAVTQVNLSDQMAVFVQKTNIISGDLGDVAALTTAADSNAVVAINEIELNHNNLDSDVGTRALLTTTDKSNLVSAINEIELNHNNLDSDVGTRTSLITNDRTDLVAAINEVKADANGISGNLGSYLRSDAADSKTVGDLNFVDNVKATFGDSNDLEIYHNGSDTFIEDNGTGNFLITTNGNNITFMKNQAETMAVLKTDGAAELYHDNALKLATTATGADITGVLTSDGLTVDGDVTLNDAAPNLRLKDTDTNRFVDLLYGTRVSTIRNTMASGEDMDTVEPSMVFSFKDDGETRTAMTIDHDAATKIHSSGGATPTYSHTNNAEGLTFRYNDDGGARAADIIASGNTPAGASMNMRFHVSQSGADAVVERMRIDDLGRMTIGHTSSINIGMLGVSNRASGTSRMVAIHNAGGTSGFFNQIAFRNNADGANIGEIVRVNDASVQYNTTSDKRLKDNIETLQNGTDLLNAMRPVTFNWKTNGFADTGFVAQEMLEVMPTAVNPGETEDDMMSMDYGRITPIIVAALQEANKKIEELQNRIEELEAK
jgi:hypothetical protein